jgi:hypothetical protein
MSQKSLSTNYNKYKTLVSNEIKKISPINDPYIDNIVKSKY